MDDLFISESAAATGTISPNAPLAARFRPRTLEEYIGQSHLLAPGKPLRLLIEADPLTSLILFAPPGIRKTSLAEATHRHTLPPLERLIRVQVSVASQP